MLPEWISSEARVEASAFLSCISLFGCRQGHALRAELEAHRRWRSAQ